jgi:flagellar protein FlbD
MTAVIPLHRLTHPNEPVYVNPDLISTIEAHPDTVVTFVNASKLVVAESAEEVTELVCDWRARVVARALDGVAAGDVDRTSAVGIATVSHLPLHPQSA